ncbi:hypothetical protein ACQZ6H_17905 [Agrobacterium fabrum]|uniref:hypothetical protein n=1 Tax=Agrobacterium fabrum TaxID=1176649 RepID=UPI0015747473|nr:hypothetical protein [Agrobacterium fabrum]WIE28935.1 hypothetical protein G6L42_014020 [Agrobacterium fabrum]WIE44895.1 hypothetical protein G6L76_014035 [Agrobacterium fabrum]
MPSLELGVGQIYGFKPILALGGNAPKANMVRVAIDQEANHAVPVMVIVDRSHDAG